MSVGYISLAALGIVQLPDIFFNLSSDKQKMFEDSKYEAIMELLTKSHFNSSLMCFESPIKMLTPLINKHKFETIRDRFLENRVMAMVKFAIENKITLNPKENREPFRFYNFKHYSKKENCVFECNYILTKTHGELIHKYTYKDETLTEYYFFNQVAEFSASFFEGYSIEPDPDFGEAYVQDDVSYKHIATWFDGRSFTRKGMWEKPEEALVDKDLWDDWKNKNDPEAYMESAVYGYQNQIYPAISTVAINLLKDKTHADVLEFCMGDGELSEIIMKSTGSKIKSYCGFDISKPMLKIAEKTLSQFSTCKLSLLVGDIEDEDFCKVAKEKFGEKKDLIIGSGALTNGVLTSKKAALKVFDFMNQFVKSGTIVILSGLHESWIDEKDFESSGYRVFNTYNPSIGHDFYIARKMEIIKTEKEESKSPK